MSWLTFHLRTLAFHRNALALVALCVAVATAVLTGALIVGDSMRHSLRDLAVGRLGRVDYALVAPRLFGDDLGKRMAERVAALETASILMLRGAATNAESHARVGRINVLGIDEKFWMLDSQTRSIGADFSGSRSVLLNEPLAQELGVHVGDDVILHLGKPSAISTETLLGRRDETTATMRLTVAAILQPSGLASFELNPRQAFPRNALVPIATLQRVLNQLNKANVVIAKGAPHMEEQLNAALKASLALYDAGLTLREVNELPQLESDALLIDTELELAVDQAASETAAKTSKFLAYLANTIALADQGAAKANSLIPYSTVLAVDPDSWWMDALREQAADRTPTLSPGSIVLNQWAAEDLQARPGDSVTLTYYITGDAGHLDTRTATFKLEAVVSLEGVVADPDLVPKYEGITDARSLADWNPPFPIDLKLIRDKDEDYWKDYRTTPKAFISLADGQKLWAESGDRFGRLTSIRISMPENNGNNEFQSELAAGILDHLNLPALGFQFKPVREQMIASSSGPTDFGMLFLSFSFFLIASAAMLVALLFRLGVEKRAYEIGLLLASGFAPQTIAALILTEGLLVSLLGTLVGLAGAALFAWLMLAGLTSWWSAAVNAPLLRLHLLPTTLVLGAAISLLIAVGSMAWSVRGLTRRSPRRLLAGSVGDEGLTIPNSRWKALTLVTMLTLLLVSVAGVIFGARTEAMSRSLAFFSSGATALTLSLMMLSQWLRRRLGKPVTVAGTGAMLRLGMRSARRNRRRSLLTAGLIASASFLIVSLEAFRLDPTESGGRNAGSGGFALYAESAAPLPYDPSTPRGRNSLGLNEIDNPELAFTHISSFRLRTGDESSCLNLYRPTRPRILGANQEFITRGGFAFAESMARSQAEKENPWLLLLQTFSDGAVPAVADANAVRWQYHLGLGKDLVIDDEKGGKVTLRFVGLLSNSSLQDEIIISDENFVRLSPSISGRAFFLIETPHESAGAVERSLEEALEQFGFDAATTQSRLRNYFAVQNTYISTFQTLGGLGFLLGAAGLAAVMARNVWERRRELAIMRTTGFTRSSLGLFVMAENLTLVVAGIACGVLSALLAISPLIAGGTPLPIVRLATILSSVMIVGAGAGWAAISRGLRAPLLGALRSE